jgi:hypothetical protein
MRVGVGMVLGTMQVCDFELDQSLCNRSGITL